MNTTKRPAKKLEISFIVFDRSFLRVYLFGFFFIFLQLQK
jgi:hypothetical protein